MRKMRLVVGILAACLVLVSVTLGAARAAPLNAEIAFSFEGDIYLLDLDSGEARNLTQGSPRIERDPAWSPDGSQVLFASAQGSDQQIYVMGREGGEAQVLTDGESSKFRPQWSPDGAWIAYAAYGNRFPQLFVLRLADGAVFNLSQRGETAFVFDWSPDGAQLVYAGASGVNLYITSPDGEQVTRIAPGETIAQVYYFSPRWSPDGSHIAFTARISDQLLIRISDADGGGQRTLTPGNVPVWSPDSRTLAYIDQVENQDAALFAVDVETGARTRLSHAYEFAFSPAWSPDGRMIAFGCTLDSSDLLEGTGYLCLKDVPTGVVLMTAYRVYHLSSPVWRPWMIQQR